MKRTTKYTIILCFLMFSHLLSAQTMTRVRGKILDATTGEPIPFSAISFKNKNIGSTSDFNGNFTLESAYASDILIVSSLGYVTKEVKINLNQNNFGLKISMQPNQIQLEEVSVVTEKKKKKYRNKGNPAVMLIREVIKRRDENRMSSLDAYSIDRYRKIGLDINNITDRFRKNPMFNNLQEIFEYVDTSEVNDKPFLPVYINESISRIYSQNDPKRYKEIVSAETSVGFEDLIDGEGVASMMSVIYKEVDIYEGSIFFLSKDFVSPIASIAPSVYRYYILDTVMIDEVKTVQLGFIPRNDAANAFKGKIWIALDGSYAVRKAELSKMEKMNLNWVNTFFIELKFEPYDTLGMFLTESHSTIDFNIASAGVGAGIFGKSSVYYENFNYGDRLVDSLLEQSDDIIKLEGYDTKDSAFWQEERFVDLTPAEEQIQVMSDHITSLPSFKTLYTVIKLILDGYWDFGPISAGPVGSLYSFNEIEGFRMRVGLRTTEKLSYHWEGEAYGAYGFNDQEWKYGGRLKYYWSRTKRNYLNFQYRRDYEFPGSNTNSIRGENFFISFRRGALDKMIDYKRFEGDFSWEFGRDLQTIISGKVMEQRGLGTLFFLQENDGEVTEIERFNTWELGLRQRWAPNQKYYQGDFSRSQITTNDPIYEVSYAYGSSYEPQQDFDYHRLTLKMYKRSTWGILGYNDFFIEAEKTFGESIPFLFMKIHTANQTYNIENYGANMMNYLEFVSDQYVYVNFTHYFDGLILNQIPFFKRLKWRSLVSGKMIFGGVTDANNPNKTDGLVEYPTDIDGNPTTFNFESTPYIEASIGIENIFNLIRIDLVKRFTYLENPNIPDFNGVRGLGLRFNFRINF